MAVSKGLVPKPPRDSSRESIAEERRNPSFPIRELTYFIDGGKKTTELKERIMLELERHPLWRVDDYPNLTLAETRERAMKKMRHLSDGYIHSTPEEAQVRASISSLVDPGFWTRVGVHYGLFFGAVQGQATPSQFTYWLNKGAFTMQGMIGCFGMTELGHGSNVAGLETTATFDKVTDEFIIHSPTITATKWWIGGAAQTATHCAVYARLIVNGKDHGTKTFVVQLRDTKTFDLMPGVNIGDIGKKMGRDQVDNGWIRFTYVRIPRSHMLMKHTKVTRTGDVIEPPLAQLAYGALIWARVNIALESADTAKRVLTIAIRYASVRRQFGGGVHETKLIDYPIHQHRLLPLVAQTFAMIFTAREMSATYKNIMDMVSSINEHSTTTDIGNALKSLKELHAASSGLKAFCSWMALDIIEKCRQTLGGHGYSSYTGIAQAYADFAVQCTWDGDNTILSLQCGRYLATSALDARNGKPLPSTMEYLDNTKPGTRLCQGASPNDVCSLATLNEAWGSVAANAIANTVRDFEEATKTGLDKSSAFERSAVSRLHAVRMHMHAYLLNCFVSQVEKSPQSVRKILTLLAQLFGAHSAVANSGEFLQSGYYSGAQIEMLKAFVNDACAEIRKDAVALTDAFNLSDFVINSPFGCYDGDVYERYFGIVTRLNPQRPVPYFDSVIRPLLERTNEIEDGPDLEIDE